MHEARRMAGRGSEVLDKELKDRRDWEKYGMHERRESLRTGVN